MGKLQTISSSNLLVSNSGAEYTDGLYIRRKTLINNKYWYYKDNQTEIDFFIYYNTSLARWDLANQFASIFRSDTNAANPWETIWTTMGNINVNETSLSNNKISIKKTNTGSGKISLFFDTLPLNTQSIRLNLGYELGGCGNDFVLTQNGVWSQNSCDFYVRWDDKNGTLPYRWRLFYSSDGRTDRASHPTAGPDSLPKKGWSNGMTISII
jgi:hypothetical protein